MISSRKTTPQDRLAASRRALVRYMTADEDVSIGQRQQIRDQDEDSVKETLPARGVLQNIQRAVRVWWHRHPAQLVLELGKPVLGKYAEEKPFQLLGFAAAVGAAVALTRPWRMVSPAGLAVTAFKSVKASGLLLSLLSTHPDPTAQKSHN